LRIEAGLRLYGTDMDQTTTPYEAGLDWTVAIHKSDFIGKDALLKQQHTGVPKKFIGFELSQGPIPRTGTELFGNPSAGQREGRRIGTVTSGTFSPILNKSLGIGYVEPAWAKPGTSVTMVVRNQRHIGTVVTLPFWKREKQQPVLSGAVAGLPAPPENIGGAQAGTTPTLEKR